MTKEQAFDILKDTFNEFIDSYDPDQPAGSFEQFSIKASGTFAEAGYPLSGPIPDMLPPA